MKVSFVLDILIIPVNFQPCPCGCPRLSTVGDYTRHFSIYIALMNRLLVESRKTAYFYRPIQRNQISSNSGGSCESVAVHIKFQNVLEITKSSQPSPDPFNLHLGFIFVPTICCLLLTETQGWIGSEMHCDIWTDCFNCQ